MVKNIPVPNQINEFSPIGLAELDSVKLLNRVDTKFILTYDVLEKVLAMVSKDYSVLELNGIRYNNYESIYFDTPELKLYHLHHNGKGNRFKLRYRKYVESNLSFFEIKTKSNKGRTSKARVKINDIAYNFVQEAQDLMFKGALDYKAWNFHPMLDILFKRMTFADKDFTERMTVDLALTFRTRENQSDLERLVIVELKQGRRNSNSKIFKALKSCGVLPYNMSKYCLGIISCYDGVKQNRFKKKLLTLEKMGVL